MGYEYELTLNLDIETNSNLAYPSKNRTSLFKGPDRFLITESTGVQLKNWANSGAADVESQLQQLSVDIGNADTIETLTSIFNTNPTLKTNKQFIDLLGNRRKILENNTVE